MSRGYLSSAKRVAFLQASKKNTIVSSCRARPSSFTFGNCRKSCLFSAECWAARVQIPTVNKYLASDAQPKPQPCSSQPPQLKQIPPYSKVIYQSSPPKSLPSPSHLPSCIQYHKSLTVPHTPPSPDSRNVQAFLPRPF